MRMTQEFFALLLFDINSIVTLSVTSQFEETWTFCCTYFHFIKGTKSSWSNLSDKIISSTAIVNSFKGRHAVFFMLDEKMVDLLTFLICIVIKLFCEFKGCRGFHIFFIFLCFFLIWMLAVSYKLTTKLYDKHDGIDIFIVSFSYLRCMEQYSIITWVASLCLYIASSPEWHLYVYVMPHYSTITWVISLSI
jgi:hypothetical protein